jgi:hypothetical protein
MPDRQPQKHEDAEIIEERVVTTPHLERIKIKVKERVASGRRHKKRLSLPLKLIVVLLAAFIGFKMGAKIVSKYASYWKKPQIQFRTPEDTSQFRSVESYPFTHE